MPIQKKVDNSLAQIYDAIGKNLKARIIRILAINNKIASGRLINSIEVISGVSNGKGFLDLFMEDYYYYIDQGRKPGRFVPPSALEDWMKLKGIPLKYQYPINLKIKREGIRGINFIDSVVQSIEKDFRKDIEEKWGSKLGIELEKSLKNIIKG